jgi:hypothetical protein
MLAAGFTLPDIPRSQRTVQQSIEDTLNLLCAMLFGGWQMRAVISAMNTPVQQEVSREVS